MDGTDEVGTKITLQRQTTEDPLMEPDEMSEEEEENEKEHTTLSYRLESVPSIPVTLFTALQHILLSLPGCLYTASAVADIICAPYDHPVRATLFCGTLFMTGLCTFLQTFLGIRLPVFQGPSASFLVPLMALQKDPHWFCPAESLQTDDTANGTFPTLDPSNDNTTAIIYTKLQQISGSLMLASLSEILFGFLGIMGILMRFIGPITIAVTVSLVGVSLVKLPIMYAKASFPVALGCMCLILVFVLYCQKVKVTIPQCKKKSSRREKKQYFPIFQLLPILIAVLIMWFLCWIFTVAGVFTDDKKSVQYLARTDAKMDVVSMSPWFQISYPGIFGAPSVNLAVFMGFIIACISSLMESVGDYYATANACEVPSPPNHAISRGILVEGLGTLISGAIGVGHATTSYSGNIGILTLSKNASRMVMYAAGGILMLMSMFGKVGAALTTIPNPILAGVSIVVHGTLVSIGFANLKHVDMTLTRNLLLVGMPFMCGLTFPACIEMYPHIIDTGVDELTSTLNIVLGSPMFVGGLLALILDNTVPGASSAYQTSDHLESSSHHETQEVYSWRIYQKLTKKFRFLAFPPFMPPAQKTMSYDLHSNGDVSSKTNGVHLVNGVNGVV